MKKRRIVEVLWSDAAHQERAWTSASAAAKLAPVKVRTVGYVLRRDGDTLVLAAGLNDSGQASGVAVIPSGMVRRIRPLSAISEEP